MPMDTLENLVLDAEIAKVATVNNFFNFSKITKLIFLKKKISYDSIN
jgi:hypothetical protein